jgi:hypothetical protein
VAYVGQIREGPKATLQSLKACSTMCFVISGSEVRFPLAGTSITLCKHPGLCKHYVSGSRPSKPTGCRFVIWSPAPRHPAHLPERGVAARGGIMEIATDSTARIAADILIAALEGKALAPR